MNASSEDKAEYIIAFISEFAKHYGLSHLQAYRYLARYKAIDFLENQYNVAHTMSLDSMVVDMAEYCKRFGGKLS